MHARYTHCKLTRGDVGDFTYCVIPSWHIGLDSVRPYAVNKTLYPHAIRRCYIEEFKSLIQKLKT